MINSQEIAIKNQPEKGLVRRLVDEKPCANLSLNKLENRKLKLEHENALLEEPPEVVVDYKDHKSQDKRHADLLNGDFSFDR